MHDIVLPGCYQVFQLTLHSTVVENHEALEAQLLAGISIRIIQRLKLSRKLALRID